jgi:maleylacetoacetate isomerase/maleylpyruvate isomerase
MPHLVLYNYFRSSTSFRVRAALYLKGLDFEYRPVNLLKGEQHLPEYRSINPMGGVPALVHREKVISDSTAILEYLNEVFPEPSLFPDDPYLRARVREVCEIVNSSMHPYGNLKVLQHLTATHAYTQEQKDQWVQKWTTQGLEALETILSNFAGNYCFGNRVTMADLYVFPQLITCQRFNVDLSKYSLLMKIFKNCEVHPDFIKAHLSNQIDTPEELRKP